MVRTNQFTFVLGVERNIQVLGASYFELKVSSRLLA